MDSVTLKQITPFRQKLAIGIPLITFGLLIYKENLVFSIIILFLSLIVFSLSHAIVITKVFNNYYEFYTLGIRLFKVKKKLSFPDYVSLFNQSFIQTNHEGFSPNTLSDTKYKMYTIKFFKGNKNDIIFESTNKELVIGLCQDLCSMLGVELYNTLE